LKLNNLNFLLFDTGSLREKDFYLLRKNLRTKFDFGVATVLLAFADTESIFAIPFVSVILDSVSTTFTCDYPVFLRRSV